MCCVLVRRTPQNHRLGDDSPCASHGAPPNSIDDAPTYDVFVEPIADRASCDTCVAPAVTCHPLPVDCSQDSHPPIPGHIMLRQSSTSTRHGRSMRCDPPPRLKVLES